MLLSRDVAHSCGLPLSILTLVPEVPTVKHADIICYMLEFPSTFIKLCHACEEVKSNAKCNRECYIKFDNVCISLTRERYWYKIRDVLVPILHAVLGIGTNS